ncbi:DEAD/DEAH box helicase family protein [Nocardioides marmoraquaticus]
MADASSTLANPVLNGPYDPPSRHFELGVHGPTGRIVDGRRPSESFIPIAPVRKGKRGRDDSVQESLVLTHERTSANPLVNELRREVEIWRARRYDGVTAITRKLLLHWADPARENRVLFAQREAVETAIYLAEVAGSRTFRARRDFRVALAEHNEAHNSGLPRVGLKMATGSGKTVVMAMLIAWQALNHVAGKRGFSRRFLVVAPGITIRDRLRVLQPGDAGNYYDERDLVPPELRPQLGKAQVLVVNYHQFLPRDSKEIKGVASATRKILLNGRADPFRESEDAVVSRPARLGRGVAAAAERHRRAQRRGAPLLPGQAGPGRCRSRRGGS